MLEERFSNIKIWKDDMAMDWKPSYEFITPPIHSYFELLLGILFELQRCLRKSYGSPY